MGGQLKVRVLAPPEDGRANRALCALIARELGVSAAGITVLRGHGGPVKMLWLKGVSQAQIDSKWARPG